MFDEDSDDEDTSSVDVLEPGDASDDEDKAGPLQVGTKLPQSIGMYKTQSIGRYKIQSVGRYKLRL